MRKFFRDLFFKDLDTTFFWFFVIASTIEPTSRTFVVLAVVFFITMSIRQEGRALRKYLEEKDEGT